MPRERAGLQRRTTEPCPPTAANPARDRLESVPASFRSARAPVVCTDHRACSGLPPPGTAPRHSTTSNPMRPVRRPWDIHRPWRQPPALGQPPASWRPPALRSPPGAMSDRLRPTPPPFSHRSATLGSQPKRASKIAADQRRRPTPPTNARRRILPSRPPRAALTDDRAGAPSPMPAPYPENRNARRRLCDTGGKPGRPGGVGQLHLTLARHRKLMFEHLTVRHTGC